MNDFVTLTCPSCGGKLQITNDIEQFVCGHCGNEHIVRRSGGIIAIASVIEGIKKVQAGTDKTASELAIKRLRDEIYALKLEYVKLSLSVKKDAYVSLIGRNRNWVKSWVIVDYLREQGRMNNKEHKQFLSSSVIDSLLTSLSSVDLKEIEFRAQALRNKNNGEKRKAYEELIEWCKEVKSLMQTIQDKSSELKLHEQKVKM